MEVSSGNGSWERKAKTFKVFYLEGGEGSTWVVFDRNAVTFFFSVLSYTRLLCCSSPYARLSKLGVRMEDHKTSMMFKNSTPKMAKLAKAIVFFGV